MYLDQLHAGVECLIQWEIGLKYKHAQIAEEAFKYRPAFSCTYRGCNRQNILNHSRIKTSIKMSSNRDGLKLCRQVFYSWVVFVQNLHLLFFSPPVSNFHFYFQTLSMKIYRVASKFHKKFQASKCYRCSVLFFTVYVHFRC